MIIPRQKIIVCESAYSAGLMSAVTNVETVTYDFGWIDIPSWKVQCWEFHPQLVRWENLCKSQLLSKLWKKMYHWFHFIFAKCFIIINMNITKEKQTVQDEVGLEFGIHEHECHHHCVKIALRPVEFVGATVFIVADNSVPKQYVKRVDTQVLNGLCPFCQTGELAGPSVKKPTSFCNWSVCLSTLFFQKANSIEISAFRKGFQSPCFNWSIF